MARKRKKVEEAVPEVAPENGDGEARPEDLLALIEQTPEGILVVEPESKEVLLANRAAERLMKKKIAKIFSEPFPEDLQDGPMRTMDLHMKVYPTTWQGNSNARYVVLTSLASQQSAFHVEWRIEAAEERARDAEERITQLEAQLAAALAAPAPAAAVADHSAELEELRGQRDQLDRQLQEAQVQFNLTHEQNLELQGQVSHLEERLSQIESELADAEGRVVRAETHARESETLMQEAEQQAQEAERHLEDLSDSVRQVEERLEEALESLRTEQSRVVTLESELAEARAGGASAEQLEHLNGELQQAEQQAANLQSELELASFSLQEKSEELDLLRAQLSQAQEQASQQQGELELVSFSLQEKQDEYHKALESLTEELRLAQEQAANLQGEVELLSFSLQEKAEQQGLLQSESSEKNEQLEHLRASLADLEEQIALHHRDLEESQGRAEAAENSLAQERERQSAQLQALQGQLLDEAEAWKARIAELESAFQDERTTLESSSALSRAEIQALRDRIGLLENDLNEANQRASEFESLVEMAEEKAERSQGDSQQLAAREARIEELQSELEQLRQQLTQEQSQGHDLLEQIEQDQAHQLQLQQQLEELQVRLAEAHAGAAAASEQAGRTQELEQALQLAGEEIEKLQQQLRQQRESEASQHEVAAEAAEELHQQLTAREAELAELRRQLAQLQETNEQLSVQLEQVSASALPLPPPPPDNSLAEMMLELEQVRHAQREAEKRAQAAEERLSAVNSEQLAGEPTAPTEATPDPETEALAFQDPLTGHPNHNLVRKYLDFALKQVNRYERNCALIHLDLDYFHVINDTLGWPAGDQLLLQVCERLQTCIRTSDVLARKGEDEFYIILSEVSGEPNHPDSTAVVVQRIRDEFKNPFEVEGQKVSLNATLGVSQAPSDARDLATMLDHAATALRRGKKVGGGNAQFYTHEFQERFEARNLLRAELRKAIDQRQFKLLFQPIINLRNGLMVGVESLLRWNHPSYGVLVPEHFLHVAEDSGLLIVLGRWIILQACQQSLEWSRAGLDIFVTINLSHREFLQADLVETLQRSLEVTGASAQMLVIEVPESIQTLDPERVQRVLGEIRALGVRVALDHFGSGFSRLESLQGENANFLKIDRRFVAGSPDKSPCARVSAAAVNVARGLAMKAIAVGIETEMQLDYFRKIDCDYVQGNLIYVPVEPRYITDLFRTGRVLR